MDSCTPRSSSAAYFSASPLNCESEASTWATAFSAGSFWFAQAVIRTAAAAMAASILIGRIEYSFFVSGRHRGSLAVPTAYERGEYVTRARHQLSARADA